MKVSVVVPFFNHLRECQEMWKSLVATMPSSMDHEFVLVDDGSSDGTREWLASLRGRGCRVLLNDWNSGYATAINHGVKHASGEFLVLGNSDLIFKSGWLEPMLDVLRASDLSAGVVGNVQTRVDDGRIDHAGMTLSLAGKWIHLVEIPDAFTAPRQVPAVTGACVALRRADFNRLGGLNEQFRNGGEDVDLCLRLAREGLLSYVALDSCISHHIGLSRGTQPDEDAERNSRLLFASWRTAIRDCLAERWRQELAQSPQEGRSFEGLDGSFEGTGLHLATLLAEHRLRIEESRWARLLGAANNTQAMKDECSVADVSASLVITNSSVHLQMEWSSRPSPRDVVIELNLVTDILGAELFVNGCHRKVFGGLGPGNASFCLREPFWVESSSNHATFTLGIRPESVSQWTRHPLFLQVLSEGLPERVHFRPGT
jgi:GT2 family glycosyltransferase